jgi:glycosyltransferase involved in cell wall biosynthesis
MRILSSLTYYTPHISGLTLYARHIHAGLVARGHSVTILTSQYERSLPRREEIDGARVVRNRVWARLSKGVLMPGFFYRMLRELHRHDVLYLHLPQIEAVVPALYAKLVLRRPVVTAYQCDLELPNGIARVLFTPLIKLSHLLTVLLSDRVVTITEDYARHSRFLRRFMSRVEQCYPPCPMPQGDPDRPLRLDIEDDAPLVGFVGRFAEEKGIAYILDAAPEVLKAHPNAKFAFVGEREKTFGERVYERLRERVESLGDSVQLLGVLPNEHLADFYRRCDLLVLPSINSTEAFGLVQVEAMLCGTPVVASDMPGVREPVRVTGMGLIVPARDAPALAAAILKVLSARDAYATQPADLERVFGVDQAVDYYEALFERLLAREGAPEQEELAGEPANRR